MARMGIRASGGIGGSLGCRGIVTILGVSGGVGVRGFIGG